MKLEQWGATEEYEKIATQYPVFSLGRVISQERNIYRVITESGEYSARVTGKFRYGAMRVSDYPAVGDFVLLDAASADEPAMIHKLLPRKSVFIRKAAGTSQEEQVVAANIDTVFLCMSLNRDFNLRRLERYLAIAWDSGADPVIVLTKKDLCDDIEEKKVEVEKIAIGVPVLETSSLLKEGIGDVCSYMQPGKTVAFIGSSGVGKSTLINRLIGENRLETNSLRNDDKGRHTTTHRELFLIPNKGLVMDTPGMRELGMWDSKEGIDQVFADIEDLACNCRFRNCSHTSEPGCAIKKALEEGTLSEERWLSYKKLKLENAYMEDAGSYLMEKKEKFKKIAQYNKSKKNKYLDSL